MILVTSAGGKTGRHVIGALKTKGIPVRAFVRREVPGLLELGASEIYIGDMLNREDLRRACAGVDVVIHTGPMGEYESVMGQWIVDAAKAEDVRHFIYNSVTHPQTEWLLNHQNKLRVENHLINSGLPFTILQPMHYFQNINVKQVAEDGVYASAYSPQKGLSFVDMLDLAEVIASISGDSAHFYATYEICGTDYLNSEEVVRVLSEALGRPIRNQQLSIDDFLSRIPGAENGYLGDFLSRLMMYYNRYGIRGNANVLTWLLGRSPTTFAQYIERMLSL